MLLMFKEGFLIPSAPLFLRDHVIIASHNFELGDRRDPNNSENKCPPFVQLKDIEVYNYLITLHNS